MNLMRRLQNQSGISLLELVIVMAASTTIAAAAGGLLRVLFVNNMRILQSNQLLTNLTMANEHLTRVGRLSQMCVKYIPANSTVATGIQCAVDFQGNGTVLSAPNVQFVLSPNSTPQNSALLYQTVSGTGSWTTLLTYTGITAFDVCNSIDMAGSNCVLNSTDGSGVNNFTTSNPGFFRFRLKSWDYLGGYSLSGSFLIRDSVLNKTGSVIYGWAGVLK